MALAIFYVKKITVFLTCQHCLQGLKSGARCSKYDGHMHTPWAGSFENLKSIEGAFKTDMQCRMYNIRHRVYTYNDI